MWRSLARRYLGVLIVTAAGAASGATGGAASAAPVYFEATVRGGAPDHALPRAAALDPYPLDFIVRGVFRDGLGAPVNVGAPLEMTLMLNGAPANLAAMRAKLINVVEPDGPRRMFFLSPHDGVLSNHGPSDVFMLDHRGWLGAPGGATIEALAAFSWSDLGLGYVPEIAGARLRVAFSETPFLATPIPAPGALLLAMLCAALPLARGCSERTVA